MVYVPNWIGDAVMAIPMVQETRRVYPDAELTVFGRNWVAPVFSYLVGIDSVISFSREEIKTRRTKRTIIRNLREGDYDKVYLLPDSFSTAWVMFHARVRERIGYTGELRSWMLTERTPRRTGKTMHRSDKYMHLLQDRENALNYGAAPRFETLKQNRETLPEEWDPGKTHIGLNPNAVATSRRYPIPYWIRLMNRISDDSRQFILFGGPGDTGRAEEILAGTTADVIDLTGKCSLETSIHHISCCDLFITNDSGLMHVSDAAGVPTLALCGAADLTETGLRNPYSRHLNAEVYCSPCVKNHCINRESPLLCLHELPPELVRSEAEYFLTNKQFR